MIEANNMIDLANQIETAWMAYNAAVANRLHAEESKQRLANILINNTTDIIKVLRKIDEPAADTESPKKVRKSGER